MQATPAAIAEAMHRLVDDYRSRCLWFLRQDYYPATPDAQLRVLDYIERHGDREAFIRATTVRQWLLRLSSGESERS